MVLIFLSVSFFKYIVVNVTQRKAYCLKYFFFKKNSNVSYLYLVINHPINLSYFYQASAPMTDDKFSSDHSQQITNTGNSNNLAFP